MSVVAMLRQLSTVRCLRVRSRGDKPGKDHFVTRKHPVTWLDKLFDTIFRCRPQRICRQGLGATAELLRSLSVRGESDFSPSSLFWH